MRVLEKNKDLEVIKKESLLTKVKGTLGTFAILLILSPFIILAGLIYGEECDDIYQ